MNTIIAWFTHNRVAANLVMLFIIVAGLLALSDIRKETFPSVELDTIDINISYPGASPREVEQAITQRVEEAIFDLDGIRKMTATARENLNTVLVEVESGFDADRVRDRIKSRIDAITSFPQDAERPVIRRISFRHRAINVVVAGPTDELSLRHLAEQVREDLLALPAISQVEFLNVKPYEIAIEISDAALRAYGMSFSEVAAAVRRSSMDLAGGVVKTPTGDVLLRAQGQAYRGDEFARIPVRALPDGAYITVGDIAQVVDGFAQTDMAGTFNTHPGIVLSVLRVGDQSVLDISEQVHQYVVQKSPHLPKGMTIDIWQDRSKMFKSRLNLLLRNAVMGLVLVFILLVLFLRLRLAFWVSAGIAVSFFGTLWVMPLFDASINMVSMFAFVLVLGIVVDDAIIVGENIFSRHRQRLFGIPAAIAGAQDVAKPVIFAAFTTVISFLPILFLPGTEGKLWKVVAIVVIATLFFSLLESLMILPAHLSRTNSEASSSSAVINVFIRLQQSFVSGLENMVIRLYQPLLNRALAWRYVTASIFVALFIVFLTIVASGWVRLVFFPQVEGDMMVATIRFAQGTPMERTGKALQELQHAAREIDEQLLAENSIDEIRNVVTVLGGQPMSDSSTTGAHVGEVALELAPTELRATPNKEILRRWREQVGDIPEVVELGFNSTITRRGPEINIELAGAKLAPLQKVAAALKSQLRRYPGVYDVRDSLETGKRELVLAVRPGAQNIGLELNDLARQVRQAFYGEEVQRIQRGRDEVKVFVRYPERERSSLFVLENMTIQLPNGEDAPLASVAQVRYERGPSEIRRIDRRRIIEVTARVDSTVTTADKVMEELRSQFLDQVPLHHNDVTWDVAGSQKDQQELINAIIRGFFLAVIAIYALVAVAFRSYVQPLIVASAVPFGVIGAIIGHMLLGIDVSLLSLSGIVAVSGVVVNDNLVLVEYINRARQRGVEIARAIREAGIARFRPIILTSLTTFAGLTPLMLEQSVQAQFLIPMAVSLAFGVMFATTVSLLFIPAAYHILEDLQHLFGTESE